MSSITLDTLITRATGNKEPSKLTVFPPSMVYELLNDPFKVWCDYHAPKAEAVDETSRYDEIVMQQGVEYEKEWVKKNHPDAVKIEPEFGIEALRNTLRAMLKGVPAIHAPQLWFLNGEIYGKGDLLIRSASAPSDLGNFHYRVKEIKHSRKLQGYHILQAAMYNRVIGHIQGYLPPEVIIVLWDSVEVVSYAEHDLEVDELLSRWRQIRDGLIKSDPNKWDKTCSPWRIYANKCLKEKMDLTLLPDVGPAGRSMLREKLGIDSIPDLYNFTLDELMEKLDGKAGTAAIYYHAQAYRLGKPILALGTQFRIPRGRRHIYFDFETSDEVHPTEPPHVYLIGAWDAEKQQYIHFLGRGAGDEERIFREFIEYVGDPEGCCLYHWTDFEIGEMRGVAERHPGISKKLNALMKSCVDLKEVIKRQVYLPVATYSIKLVAPFLGFCWRHEDVDAYESMVLYWKYLDDGDESKIHKVLDYNEDDCKAMIYVDKKICNYFGIPFIIESVAN